MLNITWWDSLLQALPLKMERGRNIRAWWVTKPLYFDRAPFSTEEDISTARHFQWKMLAGYMVRQKDRAMDPTTNESSRHPSCRQQADWNGTGLVTSWDELITVTLTVNTSRPHKTADKKPRAPKDLMARWSWQIQPLDESNTKSANLGNYGRGVCPMTDFKRLRKRRRS